ncbi:thioredoxin domain-containing protein [Sphingomonas sabuli]|uniref:Thioredoxin domain-containing protein n=1 Tax=Sphingomonas sabuli TaxID=2764186 RepID=A0A7G9L5E3_9SPHN|nr:thioredoxin domain-containing protein [Sphingomonas sabuli]QNM83842.1 thioredoxin domain-containing protein [Sphingomonas sabuli]
MKRSSLFLAAAAALASSGCNAEGGSNSAAATSADAGAVAGEAVTPPANGDWSQVVRATPQGGFVMGNPNAKAKLVELGSMTCPHCAEFEETAGAALVQKYVKTGQVSWEFRNFVRDPFDIAASLIARCNGAKTFFPLTRALYSDQREWIDRLQSAPEAQLQAVTALGPDKQFLEVAKLADLQKWAAQRGVPTAKSTQCLTDQTGVNQLVQMNSDVASQYPDFKGTPSFVLNGKLLDATATWEKLEPQLKAAVGS